MPLSCFSGSLSKPNRSQSLSVVLAANSCSLECSTRRAESREKSVVIMLMRDCFHVRVARAGLNSILLETRRVNVRTGNFRQGSRTIPREATYRKKRHLGRRLTRSTFTPIRRSGPTEHIFFVPHSKIMRVLHFSMPQSLETFKFDSIFQFQI